MPHPDEEMPVDAMMVDSCVSTPQRPSNSQRDHDNSHPRDWFRLPLPPQTSIPNPEDIQYVEYHLHFGKEARGWRNLQNFARGRPLLPSLREVRVIVDGGAIDRLTPARCKDFHMAAELIGIVAFHCERLGVVYLPHRRSGDKDRAGEPDDATLARDELQDFVVRNVVQWASFGEGRVDLKVENEAWPEREVTEGREKDMKMVFTRGSWS